MAKETALSSVKPNVRSSANKLNAAAKRLVKGAIVAGLKNREIRDKLRESGYPDDLSDAAFSKYRAHEEVKAAIAMAEAEAIQSGLGQRAMRIDLLERHESALRLRMYVGKSMEDMDPGDPVKLSMLSREWRGAISDISKLVDTQTVKLEHDFRNVSDATLIQRLTAGLAGHDGGGGASEPELDDDDESA